MVEASCDLRSIIYALCRWLTVLNGFQHRQAAR